MLRSYILSVRQSESWDHQWWRWSLSLHFIHFIRHRPDLSVTLLVTISFLRSPERDEPSRGLSLGVKSNQKEIERVSTHTDNGNDRRR